MSGVYDRIISGRCGFWLRCFFFWSVLKGCWSPIELMLFRVLSQIINMIECVILAKKNGIYKRMDRMCHVANLIPPMAYIVDWYGCEWKIGKQATNSGLIYRMQRFPHPLTAKRASRVARTCMCAMRCQPKLFAMFLFHQLLKRVSFVGDAWRRMSCGFQRKRWDEAKKVSNVLKSDIIGVCNSAWHS